MRLCGHCGGARAGSAGVRQCQCIPQSVWTAPEIIAALEDRDAAAVIRYLLNQRHLGLPQTALAKMTGLSQATISRAHNGTPIKGAQKTLQVFAGLGAPSADQQPASFPVDVSANDTDNDLAKHLPRFAGAALVGHLSVAAPDLMDGLAPTTTIPTRLTPQDVHDLNRTTDIMERWDFLYGGGLSRTAVLGQLRHVYDVYRLASCTPQVRTLLQSALARIAKVSSWMAFDAGDLPTARRCWLLGLSMATEADDARVTTSLLTDMARAAIHHGDPTTGLSMLGMAAASAPRATPTLRTAVAVVTARAHGALEDHRQCMAALDIACAHFAERDPAAEPTWMAFFDHAQFAGDRGQTLVPLALTGIEHDSAVDLLTEAVTAHTTDAARASALSLAKLSRLHLVAGDFAAAEQTVERLLPTATLVRSARVAGDLKDLFDATIPYGGDPAAGQIRHRVQEALATRGA